MALIAVLVSRSIVPELKIRGAVRRKRQLLFSAVL
jgi:hypothetical protein